MLCAITAIQAEREFAAQFLALMVLNVWCCGEEQGSDVNLRLPSIGPARM